MRSLVFVPLFALLVSAENLKILHCGHILDAKAEKWLNKYSIIVENESISAIKPGFLERDDVNTSVFDLKNLYVLPGLIDAHVHLGVLLDAEHWNDLATKETEFLALKAASYAREMLHAGFTTVRDLGDYFGVTASLKQAIEKGLVPGPRMKIARVFLKIPGGHGDHTSKLRMNLQGHPGPQEGVCNGIESCREAVRWQIKNGADWIKVMATGGVVSLGDKDPMGPSFSQEELNVIVSTASDLGVPVSAHAHGKIGIMRAIYAGVRTVEHCTMIDEDIIKLFKNNKDVVCLPTIAPATALMENNNWPQIMVQKLKTVTHHQKNIKKAYEALGADRFAFGTDAGVFPHRKAAREFKLLNELGFKPLELLRMATIKNAQLLQMDQKIGSIEIGKLADIIGVRKDPLKDLNTFSSVQFVMKDGQVQIGTSECAEYCIKPEEPQGISGKASHGASLILLAICPFFLIF